jgi:hypothetical protein
MELLERQTEPARVIKRRGRPSDRAIQAYRRRIIERDAESAIAKDLKVSGRRVRQLVARVVRWSKEHEAGDVLAIKIQHTQILYELYRDARTQWKRSCEDETRHSIVSVEGLSARGKDGAVMALPKKTTTRVSRKGQSGNPRYIEIMDQLMASIRGIWGADAPKQLTLPDAPGGTVALAVLLNASSKTVAPPYDPHEPAPNVIDVDGELAKLEAEDAKGSIDHTEAQDGSGAD